uniref:Mediator of RNA polymerase II transcription subunit 19 n=1 Tax=Callorhinchus milii TaxID=7868 RepID=V9L6W9_CALMI|eukprot:gi/632992513/ref/XP_007885135.1/ PREDICTED: mediator of RNA polymerase II transcription subunit 19 [Callorhinchus milii]
MEGERYPPPPGPGDSLMNMGLSLNAASSHGHGLNNNNNSGGSNNNNNGGFYLVRDTPVSWELTASTNLITHYTLEHTYTRFCGKKVKDKLSNFLPDLPGMIDMPGSQDSSSLRSLIEKAPICGNSFTLLTGALLTGFRLHTGPLPDQYRLMHMQPPRKKNKHKHNRTQDPVPPETPSDSDHKKKKKKKDDDPERKKRKKEKKKKKNRHSPDPGLSSSQPSSLR